MLPSQETNRFWLFANNSNDRRRIDPNLTGKLMLFIKKEQLDNTWLIIKDATEKGLLSYNSKCSTAKENPNKIDDVHGLICVYTPDCNDIDEIKSVEKTVRRLVKYQGPIYYKTDVQTNSDKQDGDFVYLYKLEEQKEGCTIL